jgi:hypothetical protein
VSRSPLDVLSVAGALAAVFVLLTALLVARDERGAGVAPRRVRKVKEPRVRAVKEPRVRKVKEPRVRTPTAPPVVTHPEPREVLAEPDPRRESLVLNLDAFTGARSRERG